MGARLLIASTDGLAPKMTAFNRKTFVDFINKYRDSEDFRKHFAVWDSRNKAQWTGYSYAHTDYWDFHRDLRYAAQQSPIERGENLAINFFRYVLIGAALTLSVSINAILTANVPFTFAAGVMLGCFGAAALSALFAHYMLSEHDRHVTAGSESLGFSQIYFRENPDLARAFLGSHFSHRRCWAKARQIYRCLIWVALLLLLLGAVAGLFWFAQGANLDAEKIPKTPAPFSSHFGSTTTDTRPAAGGP